MTYPELKLLPKKEKSFINRHPWIFTGAVQKHSSIDDGAIVKITSSQGLILGFGFYSFSSQIICRMFDWEKEPQDFLSTQYWKEKIHKALQIRKNLINPKTTNAYRLIHAEGDFMPGVIVDIYNNIAVIQLTIKGVENIKSLIFNALQELGFTSIYLKGKVSSHVQEDMRTSSSWICGEVTTPVVINENGLKFFVDFVNGQKTGFFIDQRENRKLVEDLALNKTVLNAFSFTGGFSVYALKGKAKEVYSLDISEEALKLAKENVSGNGFLQNHTNIFQDCFEYLKEMPSDFFDLIILDPPAFAKNVRSVDNAARGYKQINMRAFQKIKSGGLLFTFSCSQNISKDLFQKIIFGAAADAKRNVRIIHQLHQPPDHPINIFHPEGEYLKGLVLWVE